VVKKKNEIQINKEEVQKRRRKKQSASKCHTDDERIYHQNNRNDTSMSEKQGDKNDIYKLFCNTEKKDDNLLEMKSKRKLKYFKHRGNSHSYTTNFSHSNNEKENMKDSTENNFFQKNTLVIKAEESKLITNNELEKLEVLKNKIKQLESKISEINKDEKEKKIIDSLREFRHRNISGNI
jgi:hypothetical protein